MMLSKPKILDWMEGAESADDPLVVTPPAFSPQELRDGFGASIDLRLGRWFSSKKARSWPILDVYEGSEDALAAQENASDLHYVSFEDKFVLHPRSFVLGVTLEWIRIPNQLAAMVTGKSSWGRRGLIVETAPGVHPGFSGCLTLEITNVGEIPIAIKPGENICQLFFYRLDGNPGQSAAGRYFGQRQPKLGELKSTGLHEAE